MFISLFAILALLLAFVVYRSTGANQRQSTGQAQPQTGPSSSWFDSFSLQGLFPRPSYSFSNVENDVLLNPYAPPMRDDSAGMFGRGGMGGMGGMGMGMSGGMPINVRTQGVNASYRQVGILTRQNGSEMILPLMGRPLMANRDKWQFYTMNENNVKLPIVNKGKSCTGEYGCDNLYNGDSVFVEGIKDAFNVTVYDNAIAQYIPFA